MNLVKCNATGDTVVVVHHSSHIYLFIFSQLSCQRTPTTEIHLTFLFNLLLRQYVVCDDICTLHTPNSRMPTQCLCVSWFPHTRRHPPSSVEKEGKSAQRKWSSSMNRPEFRERRVKNRHALCFEAYSSNLFN